MVKEIVRSLKPEEKELNKKKQELLALEEQLAERELELASLNSEMAVFESIYLKVVGTRFARLDAILAQIAEYYAKNNPRDAKAAEEATQARRKADQSGESVKNLNELRHTDIQTDEEFKKLFREVAKKVHPDLCLDEADRLRREKLMSLANQAFENGDSEKLLHILNEYETSPESVKGEDIGAQLIRVLRKISQVEERLSNIDKEMEKLKKSDLYQLKVKASEAEKEGRDLLDEMVAQLESQIALAEQQLKALSHNSWNN